MEIFLYDQWPIRAEATLVDRLSVMPVRISYKHDGSADAWRWDWPVGPSAAVAVQSKPIRCPKGRSQVGPLGLLRRASGACRRHHLTIGRGVSGCLRNRSIVSSTSR